MYLQDIPKSFEDNKNYYINAKNLTKLYKSFLDRNEIYNAKWCENDVISIFCKRYEIHAAEQYPIVNQACKDFKLEFNNQTLSKLARESFEEHIENNKYKWKSSVFSPEVEELYKTDFMKSSAFNITVSHTRNTFKKVATVKLIT